MTRSISARAAAWTLGLALVSTGCASSRETRALTLDDLYDPDRKIDFSGAPVSELVWLDDEHYLWPQPDGGSTTATWIRVEAASGKSEPFYDAAQMTAALARIEGVSPERAARLARQRKAVWNPGHTALLVDVDGDLYHCELGSATPQRLTQSAEPDELPTYSPDGRKVAFVRAHDLFVVDLESGAETRLTSDGSDQILNGKLDWLYQEEVYGRGEFRSFWWSPDSTRLAFLQLDETHVPRYTIVDDIATRPDVEVYPYPKAGDTNPTARLGIADAAGASVRWVDTERYAQYEPLIVQVAWSKDGATLSWQVQDREQRWLELCFADPATGASQAIVRETTPAWVDRLANPYWLADGSFLWLSERNGWSHLYHYRRDGTLVRQLTSGSFVVREVHGVDERAGRVYLSATAANPIGVDVYRVPLSGGAGGELELLSGSRGGRGTHEPVFNPELSLWIDTWSDLATPPQVELRRSDGGLVRVVDANPVPELAEHGFRPPERVHVSTRDGFAMEAILVKPPDFDDDERHPVLQHVYGGPGAPMVRDRWPGTRGMLWQLLAQRGIVVWVCDNRTASGKGAVSTWPAYQRLGELELADIEDGIAWLKEQRWVDPARIGINGWSYGGLMVAYALTHSKSFCMGIAGGPVTDWRNYDSIYTERYMRTPENNLEGYERTAPRNAAADLHGELLLVHGAIDDNVHPQNTLQLAYELQKAGKPFRMMLYPKSKHAVSDPELAHHMNATMLDFIEETLLRSGSAP